MDFIKRLLQQDKKKVTVVCISDTHTKLNYLNVPDGDILIHAGDFSFVGSQEQIRAFIRDFQKLPHRFKILIAGNHEVGIDPNIKEQQKKAMMVKIPDRQAIVKQLKQKFIYLEHQAAQVMGIKIFGSPFTQQFGGWGFSYLPEHAQKVWAKIQQCHILVTHGPPFGILDKCYDGVQAGCPQLLKRVKQLKPKLHVFGHIHQQYGVKKVEGTTFVNASSLNLGYKPVNRAIVVDL